LVPCFFSYSLFNVSIPLYRSFTDVTTILTIDDKIYTTIGSSELTNELGESVWSVTLDRVSDEGPFDIHVSQPLAHGTLVTITIHDILFGDV